MVVKVYGFVASGPTQIAVLTLKELGVPYEFVAVDAASLEHKSPTYLKKQPFGQVPYIDDDGFILFEGRAIARYLVQKYGPDSGLIPKGLKENALFEQAASVEVANFSPHALGLALEKFFNPIFFGVPTNEAKAEEHLRAFEEKLKVYDVILGKQKYVAGDNFTLADLFHLPFGSSAIKHAKFKGFDDYPNVNRWWNDITSRPSYKEVWAGVEEFKAKLGI